ncbi:MAG: pilus (MSHA type) biogenesis protein MshL [Woeseiaceae bacterium]|nr:pilus (MSHA type) biogenesis protein MshL [Woeseiaceae bacterium]
MKAIAPRANRSRRTLTATATLVFAAVGCAPMTQTPQDSASGYQQAIDALRSEIAGQAQRDAARTTGAAAASSAAEHSESTRFDIDSVDTPARYFFQALTDYTSRNIVVHPDVSGSLSLTVSDVTVTDVLEIAEEVYGYSHRLTPSAYIVYPASMRTRIFEIDYLDLQRSGSSRTRVSSGQISEGRGGGGNQILGSFASPPVAADSGTSGQEISGSNIDTRFQADFWSELESTLQSMVSAEEGSQVMVNSQAGVVMVRALPQSLRNIESYLQTIEEVSQRQVVLEAKIIEVALNDAFQAGINWIAVAQDSDGDSFTFGQTAPPPGFAGDLATLGGDERTLTPGNVVDSLPIRSQGGAFTMAFDVGDFNAFLELLQLHGDTRVLSSPRVSTLNNQKAVIKAGTDEFFVTNVSSNTVTGASSTTSRDVELTPFFSGIALDVTPQISSTGDVTLHIHPTVSEVTDQQKNLTVSGETDVLPLAFSEIRESDSVVKAKSGQIIVIGGLMRDSESEQRFGLPGLSRLPGVGRLFSSERRISRKTELVILLKPIVVQSDSDWGRISERAVTGRHIGDD